MIEKFYRFAILLVASMLFATWGFSQPIGPTNVCPGASATYTWPASPCDTAWQWSIDPPLGTIVGGQGTNSVNIEWQQTGTAVLELIVSDSCAGFDNEIHFPIFIQPLPNTIITAGICEGSGDCVTIAGNQYCAPGQYDVALTSWLGCDSIINILIEYLPSPTVNIGTLCQNQITICGQNFTGPGSYEANCISWQGCDSTIVFTLTDPGGLVADAGPDLTINCNTQLLTLNGTGSSTGGDISYVWTTPDGNILNGLNTMTPTVNSPGMYCLFVTDNNTGCQAMDCMIVISDIVLPAVTLQPTSLPCNGSPLILNGAVAPQSGSYAYFWILPDNSTIQTSEPTLILPDPSPGPYCLSVTDLANGCAAESCTYVWPIAQAFLNGPIAVCDTGQQVYIIDISTSSSPPVDVYISVNGGLPTLYADQSGAFTFLHNITGTTTFEAWVIDNNGCVSDTSELTTSIFEGDIDFTITEDGCNPVNVYAAFSGNPSPLTIAYLWSNGSTAPNITTTTSGQYYLTVTNDFGCTTVDSIYVEVDYSGTCAYIEGHVLEDMDQNCQYNAGDTTLAGWLIIAEGNDTLYGTSDADGYYFIPVPPGNYTVSVVPVNVFWEACANDIAISLPNIDDSETVDFLMKRLPGCPLMSVDISTPILRRCFSNNIYHVEYCNYGVETATNAYVDVTFDSFMELNNSSIPAIDLGNNIYRFEVGNIEPGECGNFWAAVYISCDAVLGQTHCTEALIFPDTTCVPNNVDWSGASLLVTSECNADSIYFTITNVGNAATTQPLEYVVIEDAVMYMQADNGPILGIGESFTVAFPANGSTWLLNVEQVPFHPEAVLPVLSIEGCGTNQSGTFSLGMVSQFAFGDEAEFVDIDCTENVGSYDPNDKQAMPVGYGNEHFIEPETEIEYMIRFQNTGTDTAFNVAIRDTLSEYLDLTSLRPGASSHSYEYEIYGKGVLKILFPNIMLPDSAANQHESNGFIQFKVKPRANVPLGTIIKNKAAIYFDFNPPIITNSVFHTIEKDFIMVNSVEVFRPGVAMHVFPNPFAASATIKMEGIDPGKSLIFKLFDYSGKAVYQKQFESPSFELRKNELPAGLYFFKIEEENGQALASGKLVKQ